MQNPSSRDAPTWRHFVCIKKKVDVGYCGKLSVVRERGLTAANAGEKKKGSVLENEVNIEIYEMI